MTEPGTSSRRSSSRPVRAGRHVGRHGRRTAGLFGSGPARRAAIAGIAVWTGLVAVAALDRGDDSAAPAADVTTAAPQAWTGVGTAIAEAVDQGRPEPSVEPVVLDAPEPVPTVVPAVPPPVPADSGAGRRIVFSESQQRVWLVADGEVVERTYPVSGSRFENLEPGSYAVQTRQRHATSFDYSGTMEYFVGFTTGWTAPIGFHSIPVYNDGTPEQTVDQLGTALSAGCVRQDLPDAVALWDFAPLGTPVVVTA